MPETRQCSRCKRVRKIKHFARKGEGFQSRCRECNSVIQYCLRYGITPVKFEELLKEQGGVCAICRQPEQRYTRLSVDHDHSCCSAKARSCGKCVRGLLCSNCNPLVGYARNNPKVLRDAALYLERVIHGREG